MDILERILSTIKGHRMLSSGDTVLIGLSGGADSICLASVLSELRDKYRLRLIAVYIDHGLRPEETPAEADFTRAFCTERGIEWRSESIDVKSHASSSGENLQEVARELRYRCLESISESAGAQRIALGHTLDDQVETFFMRILRGSGMRGLSGIPPVRGRIIRPLIETERDEIERYLGAAGTEYVTDSSNMKDDYLRNKIRSALIPVLRELNPNLMEVVARTSDIMREEDRYLEFAVTKELIKLITRKNDLSIELFLVPLENMNTVVLRRLLRRSIEETAGLRGMGYRHIEDIIALIKKGTAGERIHLPKGIRVIRKYSTLLITSEPPRRLGTYSLGEGEDVLLEEAGLVIGMKVLDAPPAVDGRTSVVLDEEKIALPLTVRARSEGDFFYPAGMGGRKKLQDLLVDEKVPRDERDTVPVVTSGGDIVWIAGMRADGRFAPTEKTTRFLHLEIRKSDLRR